ncbi:MAG: hypothetical protein PVSMB1_08140 [Gemmatimonadaceae bacterium]
MVALTAISVAGAARAAGDTIDGWELGLQVSAGQMLGDAGPPQFVSYRFANNYGFASASVDALRIVSPLFALGAFVQVARSGTESFCSDHVNDCSSKTYRLGLEARIGATRPASRARLAPWLGAGVAYEILHVKGTGETPTATYLVTISYPGIDLRARGGVDLLTSYGLRIGPFVEFSIGRYFLDSFSGGGIGLSSEWHESLSGGLHASLVF